MRTVSVEMMAFIIAALAWMNPARSIRAQVLSLRERAYVEIARISGMSDLRIALFEVLPNLIAADHVGLRRGGLGRRARRHRPSKCSASARRTPPTLGMTVYWSLLYGAFARNMWWWWAPPIMILAILFIGLFLISAGLDEIAQSASQEAVMTTPLLQVRDLTVTYQLNGQRGRAADGVSFDLHAGERLGIVGESGSGKSTLALALMRLHKPPTLIETGTAILGGTDLLKLEGEALRRVRWSQISMIPQGAMNSLNPVMRVGVSMADAILAHRRNWSAERIRARVAETLESVGLQPHRRRSLSARAVGRHEAARLHRAGHHPRSPS